MVTSGVAKGSDKGTFVTVDRIEIMIERANAIITNLSW